MNLDNLNNLIELFANQANRQNKKDIFLEWLNPSNRKLYTWEETEKNILASLAAKESGVKKTISQVENIDFIPLAQNMGLNTTINIKYLTANFIFKYISIIGI